MLIEAGRIASHLKSRAVTCITMLNAFKLQGAKIVKSGSILPFPIRMQLTLERSQMGGTLSTTTTSKSLEKKATRKARSR